MSAGYCSKGIISRRLEGKVAIVTGGASGIGACTVKVFVKNGAKVVIADVQDELGHSLCNEIGSEDVSFVHCDVSVDSDVKNVVDCTVSKYGKLDIMFSNVGIPGKLENRIIETDNDDFKRVLKVNVFGNFLAAKHAAKIMILEKKGCIIFTSSTASSISSSVPHAYVASKHAVNGLTKNLCAELGEHGIRVNCVSPYGVATPRMVAALGRDKKRIEEVMSSAGNLKGVILEAEDIANALAYLASDEAKYVSGMNLVVDGGYSVTNPSVTVAFQSLIS